MKLAPDFLCHFAAPEQLVGARAFCLVMLLARLALGSVLLYAGVLKAPDHAAFAKVIANFGLLPQAGCQFLALILPWLEIALGLLLLCGLWLRSAALAAVLMFLGYSGAVLYALARDLNIECGCFGTNDGVRVGLHTLAIEAAGITAGILVFIFPRHSLALVRWPKKVFQSLSKRMFRVSARTYKEKHT